jgi:hypothetical protein
MSAISSADAIAAVSLPTGHGHALNSREDAVVHLAEQAAEVVAATSFGDEPNAGRSTAETVTDEVAAALVRVQEADTPSLGIDEALAEYRSTDPQ